jgi:hypothetical protein
MDTVSGHLEDGGKKELLARLDTPSVRTRPTQDGRAARHSARGGRVVRGAVATFPSRRASRTPPNRLTIFQCRDGVVAGGSTFEFRLTRARGLAALSRIRIVLEKVRVTEQQRHLFVRDEYRFEVAVGFNESPCRRHEVSFPPRCSDPIGRRTSAALPSSTGRMLFHV